MTPSDLFLEKAKTSTKERTCIIPNDTIEIRETNKLEIIDIIKENNFNK